MFMENLADHLEKLALAFDFLNEDQAERIVEFTHRFIKTDTRAYLFDILWRREITGGFILDPVTRDKSTKRGETKSKFIPATFKVPHHDDEVSSAQKDISNQPSIWTFVFTKREPVWISGIKKEEHICSTKANGTDSSLERNYVRLVNPVKNFATGSMIPTDYLVFYQDTDSIIAFPLLYQGTVWGIFSCEFEGTFEYSDTLYACFDNIVKSLANILWKSEVHQKTSQDTKDAINKFEESVRNLAPGTKRHDQRVGFYARPFAERPEEGVTQFEAIEKRINESLLRHGAHAGHYQQSASKGVVEDILDKIKSTYFGIVDLTGVNPNVMMEFGIMKALERKNLIIKSKKDPTPLPFNVSHLPCHQYDSKDGKLFFIAPSGENMDIDNVIDSLIEEVEAENADFRNANNWDGI